MSWSSTAELREIATQYLTKVPGVPDHPGYVLGRVIRETGLEIQEFARRISCNRVSLSRIIHGHRAISPELAIKLEAAGHRTAIEWLHLQAEYDLALARIQASGVSVRTPPSIQVVQRTLPI